MLAVAGRNSKNLQYSACGIISELVRKKDVQCNFAFWTMYILR
jgi:hypothetical protein